MPSRNPAHKKYAREVPRYKPIELKKEPLPAASSPDAARERAGDALFESAGAVSENAGTAGTRKIDDILRDDERIQIRRRTRTYGLDIPYLMLVLGLLAFGLIMMYSAGYAWSIHDYGTPNYYITRQLQCAAIGLVLMFIISRVHYNFLKKWWAILLFTLVVSLMLVAVPFIGKTAGGAKRWINIGGFVSFQPSEFAKFNVIWLLAWVYSFAGKKIKNFWVAVLPLLAVAGFFCALLIPQSHLSAMIIIVATCVIMAFIAGVNVLHLLPIGVLGAAAVAAVVKFSDKFAHVLRRIAIWKDPFSDTSGMGYQTVQSLYAVASGGLFGLGLGQSRQKQLYLPEAQNDYVFAIVCEELGMVGALVVIALFTALIIRGYWIAMHAPDKFGAMLCTGITTLVAIQTLMNIAVVLNAMPVTGISLPFFSSGGTSLILLLCEMGVVLSVSKQIPK